jgi:hypothetical protein
MGRDKYKMTFGHILTEEKQGNRYLLEINWSIKNFDKNVVTPRLGFRLKSEADLGHLAGHLALAAADQFK